MRCTDEVLGKGSTTALVSRGRLRVKTTYEEGVCNCEKVEEYDVRTDELLLRKWRQNKGLAGMSKFVIEIGEEAGASAVNNVSVTDKDKDLLFRPSNNKTLYSCHKTAKWHGDGAYEIYRTQKMYTR